MFRDEIYTAIYATLRALKLDWARELEIGPGEGPMVNAQDWVFGAFSTYTFEHKLLYAEYCLKYAYEMIGWVSQDVVSRTNEMGVDDALIELTKERVSNYPSHKYEHYLAISAMYLMRLPQDPVKRVRMSRLLESPLDRTRRMRKGFPWCWFMEGTRLGKYGRETACHQFGRVGTGWGDLNNTIYLRTAMWADSCGVNFETAELEIKTKKWPDIVLPNRAKERKSARADEDEAGMVD